MNWIISVNLMCWFCTILLANGAATKLHMQRPKMKKTVPARYFHSVSKRSGDSCATVTLEDAQGTIESPVGRDGVYPNNLDCTWTIHVPSNRNAVELTLRRFNLEEETTCGYDELEIRASSVPIESLCGVRHGEVFTVMGPEVTLHLKTDTSHQAEGFKINYRAINVEGDDVLGVGPFPCREIAGLDGTSGDIKLPGYPRVEYPPSSRCEWTVTVPEGQFIKFEFTDLSIETQRECTYDSLTIRSFEASQEEIFCGDILPSPVVIQDHRADIIFVSDSSMQKRGFFLTFSAVQSNASPANPCTAGGLTLTSDSGTLHLPVSNNGNYANDAACKWKIEVSADKIIQLDFVSIDIELDGRCSFDKLKVYDGLDASAALIGTYCGVTPPASAAFTTNNMAYITFTSDTSVAGEGFTINYRTVDSSNALYHEDVSSQNTNQESQTEGDQACGENKPHRFNQASGTIMLADGDPFFNYKSNADCEWLIVLPNSAKAVTVTFTLIDIENSNDCSFDALDIYEGETRDGPRIGRFCGQTTPGRPIISETNTLLLHFHSDDAGAGSGFWLTFNASEPQLPECSNSEPVIFEGTSGKIEMDLNLSLLSQNILNCHWKIIVPQEKKILLRWSRISFVGDGDCSRNMVIVFDGPTAAAEQIFLSCGNLNIAHQNVLSSGNVFYVLLSVEGRTGPVGLEATYSAATTTNPAPAPVTAPTIPPAGLPSGEVPCGIPNQRYPPKGAHTRIVGGVPASPHSWPWMVSIQGRNGFHFCGGSIVSKNFVISAAHCFPGRSQTNPGIKVVAGAHNNREAEGTKQTLWVDQIWMHPDYTDNNNNNDIALLRLRGSITYTDEVAPICLPNQPVRPGQDCVTTGWGDTKGTGDERILNQVYVPIISHSVCSRADYYGGSLHQNTMICAGYEVGGKDACQGDSGGPLVCLDGTDNDVQRRYRLQGITSWGIGCAGAKKPGVYTKVLTYINYIQQTTSSTVQIP